MAKLEVKDEPTYVLSLTATEAATLEALINNHITGYGRQYDTLDSVGKALGELFDGGPLDMDEPVNLFIKED